MEDYYDYLLTVPAKITCGYQDKCPETTFIYRLIDSRKAAIEMLATVKIVNRVSGLLLTLCVLVAAISFALHISSGHRGLEYVFFILSTCMIAVCILAIYVSHCAVLTHTATIESCELKLDAFISILRKLDPYNRGEIDIHRLRLKKVRARLRTFEARAKDPLKHMQMEVVFPLECLPAYTEDARRYVAVMREGMDACNIKP